MEWAVAQRKEPTILGHRVSAKAIESVCDGVVVYSAGKSLWFMSMLLAAIVGGICMFSTGAVLLYLAVTAFVLLFGHSLGNHRKLVHNSFQCPKWVEYFLVYCGVQVGLCGPLGLLRQHELRDFAQRLPRCHDYLRHGRTMLIDFWWQVHCDLKLATPPAINIEKEISDNPVICHFERYWMLHQIPPAVMLYSWGGWGFVFWGVCARIVTCIVGHWFIGHLAHNKGDMNFSIRGAAVQGRNVPWTSLLTMGECWHNNHHAFPGSARIGLYPGEWDPGWQVLVVLKRLRLVWGIRLPMDLPFRPELARATPESSGQIADVGQSQFVRSDWNFPEPNRGAIS